MDLCQPYSRPCEGKILASDMVLKQRHKKAEVVTNGTKKG